MVQLTADLVRQLDERAARDGVSRSQVIRDAVAAHLADDGARARVARFVAAFERRPETAEELALAEADARALIAAEPW